VDIYIDRNKRIWIVDFGPFGNPTSPLMFDWEELTAADNNYVSAAGGGNCVSASSITTTGAHVDEDGTCSDPLSTSNSGNQQTVHDQVEFRIVTSRDAVLTSTAGASRGPIDVAAAPDFHKFMEICRSQQNESDSDDG
jgi:hypothetical protein